ncbi:uncharacterized protein LOC111347689 [Stylophora pistillata]|uniref:uncharacterized protein LOC111347689 n=1 Tax=Stylophora pistillata TaxID=50429 RepID=UPI000C041BCA|nr:uncharacterized protein LOC111347689 [Stylophora pistillata]
MAEGGFSAAWSKSLRNVPFFDVSFIETWLETDGEIPKKVVTRGYSNFCEGYIFDVEVKTQDTEVIVRARSYKSQRKNEEPWRLQVEISRTPEVKITSTSCNCEAGAGLCNHAIGLVYLLEHYRKLGLKSVPPAMSKTSLPQTWHVPQRTAGINPREVQEVLVQQVKPPSNDATQKKKIRRLDGVRSTLYNPIPEHFGSPKIIDSMRDIFKQYEDMQVNSIVPETESLDYVNSKLGRVAHGSVISYQQRQNTTNNPKIHINVEGPQEPLPFGVPLLKNNYTFVPTLAELNFAEGLSVSQAQSCLYEEETREQSDTQKWHDLRAQRLSSSKFKDVCARRADFESLAVRQLKKTVQTAAMRHGINTEEEAASAYADSGDCNVFPAGIVINPSCPHLAASPDRRVYDPSENNPWGLLEIKCPITDSISQLKYLKCVNGVYKLRKTHSYYYQIMGQMMLTGCEWVDFYVYCKSDFHLERVRFDAEFCSEMKMKLDKFYFEYLLPEL